MGGKQQQAAATVVKTRLSCIQVLKQGKGQKYPHQYVWCVGTKMSVYHPGDDALSSAKTG